MKQVKTFDGTFADRGECRKIKNNYYIQNKQCFLMPDDKWHRIDNGKIILDYETNEYTFINNNTLTKGIVGKNYDGTLKIGYFTRNIAKNTTINTGKEVMVCLSRKIAESIDAKECIGDGVFYLEKSKYNDNLDKKTIYKNYSVQLDYRCGYRLDEITNHFNDNFIGKEFKHSFYKLLPDITFGLEHETFDGRIPEDIMVSNGLIPVKDGSLRRDGGYTPFEYATVILNGKKGLQAVKKQCEILKKYCEIGIDGSTHVHIGNINRTKEYVTSLYTLATSIQDEIYNMFPAYYRNTSKFKNTATDYCIPLTKKRLSDNSDSNFDIISKEICGVNGWKFKRFGEQHPSDPNDNRKWEIKARYKFLNLVPLIFGGSGTAEFRIHGSSLDHDKLVNWIYVISAIVKYADKYKYSASKDPKFYNKISLKNIIDDTYIESNALCNYLSEYVEFRKKLMKGYSKLGDDSGKLDIQYDNIDTFEFAFKSLVE